MRFVGGKRAKGQHKSHLGSVSKRTHGLGELTKCLGLNSQS